uniref:NADH-ubiquinone oxidoreductase chain 3 n=7 Tax=strodei subgroup TaxID=44551 RepID=A0A343WD95_9DIPT|nr:NADH dehydrogenase subunit 3 [Anopheles albertoi]YP_009487777.1 NADH dehydrogenase subunit 3 [Anopheles arthuri]YP_009487803.1 NADH dehydrogenase subunit 3 [Anopheles strodei]YP_009487894.1 NADH dehydrogenase subunit 3 [Anopheles rondoni]AWB98374.1 NADH dehydrogenase subunit 3 [Anopheles aff. arthuri B PGF-2018]AWB98699.1 NADH dehydrogenase subunit 3 [Anopheles aff. arthuri D PGF-2018]AWB99232.1 NADH dehydrogenase subunit 3 [Anopheles aff. arthuri C PGF-2018]AWB98413.1 NADH dehydrogenase 
MLMLSTMTMIIMIITIVVMMLATLLSKKTLTDREKCSPFECGFDPMNSSRLPFSLRFFLIAIIFLIFDVEIALLLPMIMIIKSSNLINWTITSLFFIFILIVGLYHEWNQGALEWNE